MLVIVVECLDSPCCRGLFIFRVFGDALRNLVAHTVRRIAQQHVLNKPFLNSL